MPDPDRERLRLIAIVHDSFKGDVDRSRPKTGENHPAMRARRSATWHFDEAAVLDVIELHDDAYLAWRRGQRGGYWDGAGAGADGPPRPEPRAVHALLPGRQRDRRQEQRTPPLFAALACES